MTESRDILLSLVRSALWDVPVDTVSSDIQWDKVCNLANQHTLIGLLADGVQKLPAGIRPEDKIISKLKSYAVRNIQAHARIAEGYADTSNALGQEGIFPVLLKGHGLARNYPNPMSRQCGDIDLYVGKDSYAKAVELCMDRFESDGHDAENLIQYHFLNRGVTVELHKIVAVLPSVSRNRRFQTWTEECLAHSEVRKMMIDGAEVSLPPYRFDAVYVMQHAWHHFLNGGIGLRQICDWTMYMHRYHSEIDVDVLHADLKSFGLLKVWHMFSWIAVNKLGLPPHECPLYSGKHSSDAERMMDIIWGDGNFGRSSERGSKRHKGYMIGKLHSMTATIKRYLRIIPVYPSHILSAMTFYFFKGIYMFLRGCKISDN